MFSLSCLVSDNCALYLPVRISFIIVSTVFHAQRTANVGTLMIERATRDNRYRCIEPSAMRHLGTTLSNFRDSFYLSHLSLDPHLACVRWRRMEFRRSHLLFPGRARRVRGVTSTSRICNKEDRCDGRNIARS